MPYALRPKVEEELRKLSGVSGELPPYSAQRKMDQNEYAVITKLQWTRGYKLSSTPDPALKTSLQGLPVGRDSQRLTFVKHTTN